MRIAGKMAALLSTTGMKAADIRLLQTPWVEQLKDGTRTGKDPSPWIDDWVRHEVLLGSKNWGAHAWRIMGSEEVHHPSMLSLISEGPGRGKSKAAAMAVYRFFAEKHESGYQGPDPHWMHVSAALRECASYRMEHNKVMPYESNICSWGGLVVFDDVRWSTESQAQLLSHWIDQRYSGNLPCLFTANSKDVSFLPSGHTESRVAGGIVVSMNTLVDFRSVPPSEIPDA